MTQSYKIFSALAFFAFFFTYAQSQPCTGSYSVTASQKRCVSTPITFSVIDTSSRAYIYTWKWGDGTSDNITPKSTISDTTDTVHTFSSAANYTVWVIREDTSSPNCIDSISILVKVMDYPQAGFSFNNDSACSGTEIQFTDTSFGSGLNYEWLFLPDSTVSTAKNPKHIFDAFGDGTDSFEIKLIVRNGSACSDSISDNILVKERPDLKLTDTCNFTSLNPNITAGTGTEFRQCAATDTMPGFPICAKAITSIPSFGITNHRILWGDSADTMIGNTFSSSIPHTYDSIGVYDLTYIAKGANGCEGSTIYQVINETNPSIGISITTPREGCAPLTVKLNLEDSNSSPTTRFIWEFGDGSPQVIWPYTQSGHSIIHIFDTTSCGLNQPAFGCNNCFVVKVTAVNSCPNGPSAFLNDIKVYSTVYSDFLISSTSGCVSSTSFNFINKSSQSTGKFGCNNFQSYLWDFGDGHISTQVSPSHTYDSIGDYTVKLVAYNTCGADSITKQVRVNAVPNANSTHVSSSSSHCAPITATFTDTSTGGDLNYNWKITPNQGISYINGTSRDSANPVIKFNAAGVFVVRQLVWNNCGADSAFDTIIVSRPATISLDSIANACGPYYVLPTAQVDTGYDSTIYRWSYSNGLPVDSVRQPDTVVFSTPGEHWIKLYAENSCGSASDSVTFRVHPSPVAAFAILSDTVQCFAGNLFKFQNNSTISSGNVTYHWNYGDDSTSTDTAPDKSYLIDSTFEISLIVTSDSGCADSVKRTVIVNPNPVASFTMDTVCFGDSTTFTDISTIRTGIIDSFLYYFTATDSSFRKNPQFLFDSAGVYVVEQTVWSDSGCSDMFTDTVIVGHIPEAGFSYDHVCFSDSTAFTDTSNIDTSDNIVAWLWTFGDNNSSTLQHPKHKYNAIGNYRVVLTVLSQFGCIDSIIDSVEILPAPEVKFTINEHIECLNINYFTFTDNTQFTGTLSYKWYFGDGDSSMAQDTVYAYKYADIFYVELEATPGTGCAGIAWDSVYVIASPEAGFEVDKDSICRRGNSFAFTDTSSGGVTYHWKFGDATDSWSRHPNHAYSTADTFEVELIVANADSCRDTAWRTIYVWPMPTAAFTIDTIKGQCLVGNNYNFINNSTFADTLYYEWNFDDTYTSTLENPTHSYTYSDSFFIKLVARTSHGCKDSAMDTLAVYPHPVAGMTFSDACFGDTIQFFDATSLDTTIWKDTFDLHWDFGDTYTSISKNPKHYYDFAGTYYPELIAISTKGCTDTFLDTIDIYPKPIAGFEITTGSAQCLYGNFFDFKDTSLITSGALNYDWNFGDFANSNLKNPTHVYSSPGTYEVKLKVWSGNSCIDSAIKQVVVHPHPQAGFTFDTACATFKTNFTDISTISSGSISNWEWTFMPDSTSTDQYPKFAFPVGGNYEVQLVVGSGFGCTDTAQEFVLVGYLPKAGFTSTQYCLHDSTVFTNTSSINSRDNITTYTWSFGDMGSAFIQNPEHKYKAEGIMTVELLVTSNLGCKDRVDTNITLLPLPHASFTVDDSDQCNLADTFRFTNRTLISSGTLSYLWNFGNGPTSTVENPVKSYPLPDSFQVWLWAESNLGCRDSIFDSVFVRPMPIAGFELDTLLCKGVDIGIVDTSKGATQFHWDFGNGDTDSVQNSIYAFSKTDTFTVRQIVRTAYGCADTAVLDVYVIDTPQVLFTIDYDTARCAPLQVAFENKTIGYVDSFLWQLGNGHDTDAFVPDTSTYYQSPLTDTVYHIIFRATNMCASISYTDSVEVRPTPIARFGINKGTICSGQHIRFINNTTGNPDSFYWDFGDSSYAYKETPDTHQFFTGFKDSYYTIWMYTFNECGKDSFYQTLRVTPLDVFPFMKASDTIGCAPLTVEFVNYSKGAKYVSFDFGDSNYAQVDTVVYSFNSVGQYTVWLHANNGCSYDSIPQEIIVYPPLQASFTMDTNKVCEGVSVNLRNTTPGAMGSDWKFGDGDTDIFAVVKHAYDTTGTFIVELTAKDNRGCEGKVVDSLTVFPTPYIDFTASPDFGCRPLEVNFTNLSDRTLRFTWYFDSVNTWNGLDTQFIYQDTGLHFPRLIGESSYKCKGFAEQPIDVRAKPVASFIMSDSAHCDTPVTVQFTNTSLEATSFNWDFDNGNTSFNKNAYTSFLERDTFRIRLIASNSSNCYDTTYQDFIVYPQPGAIFTADTLQGCEPLTVQFTNQSFDALEYLWDFGDSSTSADTSPRHTYGEGQHPVRLIAKQGGGCADTAWLQDIIVWHTPSAAFEFAQRDKPPHGLVEFENKSRRADEYLWLFGDGNYSIDSTPYHIYDRLGEYLVTLTVSTDQGCSDDSSAIVPVVHLFNFYIATAFSPNNDGYNDFFFPVLLNPEDSFVWTIYDRWGEEVFQSAKSEPWDGTANSKTLAPDGVYIYVLNIISAADKYDTHVTGQVMLLR